MRCWSENGKDALLHLHLTLVSSLSATPRTQSTSITIEGNME